MRRASTALILLFAAALARGDTFTVTNTSDSGAGSLRQAIDDANANPGADTIEFNVSGEGCSGDVCTIKPLSALPPLTSPVTMDGYTQAGSEPNTNASGAINAVLTIVISGVDDPSAGDDPGFLLEPGSQGSTFKGLVLNAWFRGIWVKTAHVSIQGCFFGTDESGMTTVGNHATSIYAFGDSGAATLTVGGPQPRERNLIAGRIHLVGVASSRVEGNLIGTDAAGAAAIASQLSGGTIFIPSVEGTTTIRGNVIAAVSDGGGLITIGNGVPSAFETILQGNFIGTDVTGTVDLGRNAPGIYIGTTDVTVGGTGPGEGNVIAFNSLGVYVTQNAKRCKIRGNSIYSNDKGGFYASSGIVLYNPSPPAGWYSPLPNDAGDADTGANDRQNFPVLISHWIVAGSGSTTVLGALNSTPNTTFDLDFYSNPWCLHWRRSFLEGKTYVGSAQVTTDGNGDAPFEAVLPVIIAYDESLSATATDPDGNTSEFSQRMVVHSEPGGGNPAGVPGLEVHGWNFLPGATAIVGGIDAPSVVVNDYYKATITTPSLPPGTVNDIYLMNTDGTSGALPGGFVADFLDVPQGGNQFYSWILALVRNQITAGIGGGLYGVNDPTKRQQMAVFLIKAKHGICYTPPPCTNQVFSDVPCTSGFAPWINQLVAEGITAGCGAGHFCPADPVNRQQMAVFLLKTKEGGSYTPPACTSQDFGDVPCSSNFAPWIYELVRRQITAGCGSGNYCPTNPNTRGQMAVFIVKTFHLQ